MRRAKSRFLIAASICVASLLTAGCTSAAPANGPVTVTIWDPYYDLGTPYGKAQKKVDDEFMAQNPRIVVHHVLQGFDTVFTKEQAAVAARSGPDVLFMYGGAFAANYRRGLVDLKDRLASSAELSHGLQWVDANKTDGKTLVLPLGTYTTRMQYNKNLFSAAGLDPNNPPKTWSELTQACGALKRSGVTPIAAGFKDGTYAQWILYGTSPQTLTSKEAIAGTNDKLSFTKTPGIKAAVEAVVDLQKAGCYTSDSQAYPSAPDPLNQFKSAKAAIVFATDSSIAEAAGAVGKDNLGLMKFPIPPGAIDSTQTFGGGSNLSYSIANWSPHQDDAWKYLSFILSAKSQQILFNDGELLPNITGVKVSSDIPAERTLLAWLAEPNRRDLFGFAGGDVGDIFNRRIPEVISGETSVDDMLSELESARVDFVESQ